MLIATFSVVRVFPSDWLGLATARENQLFRFRRFWSLLRNRR
jgi:hypothetical protein